MKGTYLRKIDTGECFAWTEHMVARGDMVPWTGPLPWEKEEVKVAAPVKAAIAITLPKEPATIDPAKPETEKEASSDDKKDDPNPLQCTICGKICKSEFGLQTHMRSHK